MQQSCQANCNTLLTPHILGRCHIHILGQEIGKGEAKPPLRVCLCYYFDYLVLLRWVPARLNDFSRSGGEGVRTCLV